MSEILKVFELAQEYSVTEVEIRRGGIEAGLNAKRLAGGEGFFQLGAKLGLFHDLGRALLYVGELFVDGKERGHRVTIIAASPPPAT